MFRKRDVVVGLAIPVFLAICLIAPGQAAKKPQPAPEWSATIVGTNLNSTAMFVPNDFVRTVVSAPSSSNGYTYNFQIAINLGSAPQLDFDNIAWAQTISGNPDESELVGGIPSFLNDGLHPDADDPYGHVILWFQLPASEVDSIIQAGGSGILTGGFFYVSFGSEFEVNTSLYGFTPIGSLQVTTDGTANWTLGFNQGLDLMEQTTIITYNRKKPTSVPYVIQEILTTPVQFNMIWQKIS